MPPALVRGALRQFFRVALGMLVHPQDSCFCSRRARSCIATMASTTSRRRSSRDGCGPLLGRTVGGCRRCSGRRSSDRELLGECARHETAGPNATVGLGEGDHPSEATSINNPAWHKPRR